MKFFIRNLCLFLILVMSVGLFVACGGESTVDPSSSAEVSGAPSSAEPGQTNAPTAAVTPGATQSGTQSSNPTTTPVDTSYDGQRKSAQIGIWYSVWYDKTTEGSFWDTSGRYSSTYAGDPIYYRPLLPDGTYGKYRSGDSEIINFHLNISTSTSFLK